MTPELVETVAVALAAWWVVGLVVLSAFLHRLRPDAALASERRLWRLMRWRPERVVWLAMGEAWLWPAYAAGLVLLLLRRRRS